MRLVDSTYMVLVIITHVRFAFTNYERLVIRALVTLVITLVTLVIVTVILVITAT